MSNKKGGKHAAQVKKRGRGIKIAMISVSVLLVVLIASGAMLLHRIQNPQSLFTPSPVVRTPIPSPSDPVDDLVDEDMIADDLSVQAAVATETPVPTEAPPAYDFDQDRVNILLLGQDSSNERIKAGMNFRTDSMILATVNLKTYEVDLISIPRDSYVRINGGNNHTKINAAFVYGGGSEKDGYPYAMDTVSWVFGGLRVDYYVGYGMQAVKDAIDAMGGIEYDVDIAFTMNGRRTEKGVQWLDGQKALDYARYRGSGNGDIDRADRQQRIIMAMFQQMKSTDQLKNIPAIYNAMIDQIDTNLDTMQIAALAYWAKDLNTDKIEKHTLDGYNLMIGNTYYYILDQSKKKALVKDIFDLDIAIPAGEDFASIKAKAQEITDLTNRLSSLISHVQACVDSGSLSDPGAQSALSAGYAAQISGKSSEIQNAISLLNVYSHYSPAPSTPVVDPYGGGMGYFPPLIEDSSDQGLGGG